MCTWTTDEILVLALIVSVVSLLVGVAIGIWVAMLRGPRR
jgi:uncharacterized protein YneF (UPF0154 family)